MTPTNREKMNGLTDEQLAKLMTYYLPKIGSMWTVSYYGIAKWFQNTVSAEEWDYIKHDVFGE